MKIIYKFGIVQQAMFSRRYFKPPISRSFLSGQWPSKNTSMGGNAPNSEIAGAAASVGSCGWGMICWFPVVGAIITVENGPFMVFRLKRVMFHGHVKSCGMPSFFDKNVNLILYTVGTTKSIEKVLLRAVEMSISFTSPFFWRRPLYFGSENLDICCW